MRLIKGETYYTKPWYNSYRCMMSRCYRERDCSYSRYGGRGIKVCDEWHDIRNFEKWVNENPYEKGMTLDRIDVNADYSPSNCRWANMKTQCNNRSNTIHITHNGETHTITEWAEITGLKRSTINNRYCRGDRGDRLLESRRYNRGSLN